MARRIKKAKISFLSLCPKGANGLPTILKDDGSFSVQTLTKAGDDFDVKGELLNVVYAPEMRDSQGDIASAEVIKGMMYDAAKDGMKVDIRHDGRDVGRDRAYVAESFIVQKGDPRFADFKDYAGKPVDVTGGWGTVLKIDDAALRAKYKSGEWAGVSMGGTGEFEVEKSDDHAGVFLSVLKGIAGMFGGKMPEIAKTQDGDDTMTPEQTNALKTEIAKDVTAALTKTLTEAGVIKAAPAAPSVTPPTPGAPVVEQAPVMKGSWAKPEDVKTYQRELKAFNLRKAVTDWSDQAQVDTYLAEIAKLEVPAAGTGTPVQKTAAEIEVERLEKQLVEARRASNQPAAGEGAPINKDDKGIVSGLNKENLDAAKLGAQAAQTLNKMANRAA